MDWGRPPPGTLLRREHSDSGHPPPLHPAARSTTLSRSPREDAELLSRVDDKADHALQRQVHRLGHQLERFCDLLPSAELVARLLAEPAVEVVLARRARLAADAPGQPGGAERESAAAIASSSVPWRV